MRITLNRKKAEKRLNVEATEADLLKWDVAMMRFTDRNMTANAYLNDSFKNLKIMLINYCYFVYFMFFIFFSHLLSAKNCL